MQEKLKPKYTNRFVFYLDVLGFASQVARSESDTVHLRRVLRAYEVITFFQTDAKDFNVRIFAFSDTIVASCSDDFEDLARLIEFIDALHVVLWEEGILLRGAVAFGALIHEDEFVFGPALIEAYSLENQIARYPRVIVAQSTLERFHEFGDQEARKTFLSDRLNQDEDGCIYLNIIGSLETHFVDGDRHTIDNGIEVCRSIAGWVAKHLGENINTPRIWEKYVWFANHYNDFVSSVVRFAPELPRIDVHGTRSDRLMIRRPDDVPRLRSREVPKK